MTEHEIYLRLKKFLHYLVDNHLILEPEDDQYAVNLLYEIEAQEEGNNET